jgi:hypothetical protein
MAFSDKALQAKYTSLGFAPIDLGMRLQVGAVKLEAVEHPFKGVVVFFSGSTPRAMTHYEAGVAKECSVEQIAGVIYANVAKNFREDADAFKHHITTLGIPLFQ